MNIINEYYDNFWKNILPAEVKRFFVMDRML